MIETAYSILSDPQKKDLYDRYGMEAVKDSALFITCGAHKLVF